MNKGLKLKDTIAAALYLNLPQCACGIAQDLKSGCLSNQRNPKPSFIM